MNRLACLALLLVSSSAFAGVTIEGNLAPKRVAILTCKESKDVIWDVYPEPDEYAELGGGVVFAGSPGTTYTVKALVIDFTAKTKDRARVVVKFAGDPIPVPPAPGPNPGPAPPSPGPNPPSPPTPAPVDAFTTKLLAAYAKESAANKAALVKGFAEAYRTKSTEAKTTNAARFYDFMLLLEISRTAVDDGALTEIRSAISAELNTVLPTVVTTPIDDAGRQLLSAQMLRIAQSLEACK